VDLPEVIHGVMEPLHLQSADLPSLATQPAASPACGAHSFIMTLPGHGEESSYLKLSLLTQSTWSSRA
jgi:hypothetical protein